MKKPLLFTVLAVATLVSQAFGTCAVEGQHTSGGGVISIIGGAATLFQVGNTGCFIYITHVQARVIQTSGTAGDANLVIWSNSTCTGSPTISMAKMGISATNHAKDDFEFNAAGGHGLRITPTGAGVCVGFDGGVASGVESVVWEGYFSANL